MSEDIVTNNLIYADSLNSYTDPKQLLDRIVVLEQKNANLNIRLMGAEQEITRLKKVLFHAGIIDE